MERGELERLDRDALIGRAEEAGVSRARILTRPELIDELLVRTARVEDEGSIRRARGFFGLARDLLARVVERGLHLPDAADMIRATRPSAPPPARSVTAVLPTVTLAEIYATQGHRDRAVETLRRVLDHEPEHGAARTLLTQLEDAAYVAPPPPLPPEDDAPAAHAAPPSEPRLAEEPARALEGAPLVPKNDVDECVAIPVDPTTLFVCWEARDATLAHLGVSRPGGVLAIRLLVVVPSWDGPKTTVVDQEVSTQLGDRFLRGLHHGAIVRAAIGWRSGGTFLPLAHSPALETAPGAKSGLSQTEPLTRWTERGAFPVSPDDADGQAIVRASALARARANLGVRPGPQAPSGATPGSGGVAFTSPS